MSKYTPGFKVWLEKDGEVVVERDFARVLEGVRKLGSLMSSARALGFSYAYAWNLVDKAQRLLGERLVEARRGGEAGGGAQLTYAGLKLLEEYKLIERKVKSALSPVDSGLMKHSELFVSTQVPADLTIIGSHCVGVDLILEMLREEHHFICEVVHVGSSGGFTAVMLGECDIAGVHLIDEVSGEYNTPFLKRYWVADKAVLIRGYNRELGLMVLKSNPKKIVSLDHLLKRDVRMVNRNLGSGTRTLLDILLASVAKERRVRLSELTSKIRGYEVEVSSHNEVAEMVKHGEADVGFGIRPVAERYELDFQTLADEHFDFLLEERRLSKPIVKSFLKVLRSRSFRHKLHSYAPGLRTVRGTGEIVYRP